MMSSAIFVDLVVLPPPPLQQILTTMLHHMIYVSLIIAMNMEEYQP